jgi:hypothetical protein
MFEILTAAMKTIIIQHFGGASYFHLHEGRV